MTTLKTRLAEHRVLLAPGVYDALSALIAEQAGFEALYLSGASIAYTALARSDIGLTTATEVAEVLSRITERVRTLPARMVTRRTTGNVAALGLVRRAHEALAKLSTHNAEEFEPVIAALAREAQAPA